VSIYEGLKDIVSTIQKIDNVELYRQILDLQREVLEVVSENTQLKAQLAEAQAALSTRRDLRFEFNAYWIGESLELSDGPFCAKCWDTKQQLVRMLVQTHNPQWSRCYACDINLRLPRKENGFDKSPEDSPRITFGGSRRRDLKGF
jgi:hypothetical protein